MDFLFPHDEHRKIQTAFMNQVFTVIKNKGQLIVHAPTGTGKTSSVLAPALTYTITEKKNIVIFFLTSRTTQHLIAVETLKKIKNKFNIPIVVVDLISKKNMCNQPGVLELKQSEFLEYCKEQRENGNCEYYSKLKVKGKASPESINHLKKLKDESPMHVEEINAINFKAELCSYEMATILGKEAQVIIADYNYILSSHIRTSLFKKINKTLSDCIIIFDEGHNVPIRARELLTTNLNSMLVEAAAKETKFFGYKEISQDLLNLKAILDKLIKKLPLDKNEVLITKDDFYKEIENYDEQTNNFTFVAEQILENKKRSFTQSVATFMSSWTGPNEGFARILTRNFNKLGKPYITLSYRCLDPSLLIKELVNESHSLIFMSGTLTPLEMYADLLGVDQEKLISIEYQNPFPQENRLNIIVPETSTKYTQRNPAMYETIAKKCAEITDTIPGNSIIFFPSYYVLNEVNKYFKQVSSKTIFVEDSLYNKEQRGDLLERFKEFKDMGAILLGVAGGSFAEGIDLPGDLLKGVIVVGLPLAKPDLETQELINYYDKRYGKGWDYGYTIPAIIKILQSAGRCIRSEKDRGIVVFMDERYTWQNYKKCFSPDMNIKIEKNPANMIKEFFSKNNKP